jgi:uncharacterized protein DUF6088
MTIAHKLMERIAAIPVGEPFSGKGLLSIGTRAAMDQSLSRLVKSGALMRVTRGVYLKPKQNKYVGAVIPEPLKIVQAKLAAEKETVQVHGAEAARQFELTTQVPTTPVFYTSGSSRHFRIGNLRVNLKRVSPRKLLLAGTPAGTALSALWYIGKENVSESVIEKIQQKLPAAEFETLKAAKGAMPGWMADAFNRYEQQLGR